MITPTPDIINEVLSIRIANRKQLRGLLLDKRRSDGDAINQYEVRQKKIKESYSQKMMFEELTCPICLEMFQRVATTVCGHAFCEMCLLDSIMRKAECPVCRVKIRQHEFQYCQSFDTRLQRMVELHGTEEQKAHYNQRRKDHQDWLKNKEVSSIVVGDKVDVMDSSFIWCVAIIEEILSNSIRVHYEGWGKDYDEYIPLESHRLAKFGFYTSRLDTPQYPTQMNLSLIALLFSEDPPLIIPNNL